MFIRHGPLMAVFFLCMAVAGFLQFSSPGLAGNDGYYHIAMGALIWDQGLSVAFPYLEFTLLNEAHFVDMHMLFHVLQAPFTVFLDLESAAKVSSTVFIALTFSLFVWLLRQYDIRYSLFWALVLLILSESFLYRMLIPRPPVFALAYTWLAFHFLMQGKFKSLALIACLFVWTYKVFPILFPMAIIAMIVFYMEKKAIDFRPLLAVVAGVAIGLVVNPYFPDNIYFLLDAMRMKIFAEGFQASVGNEWYPLKTLALLKDAAVPLAAYLAGALLTNREEWKADPCRLFWFLLATMWLIMLFKSRRFIEFFPPAALLFFIYSIRPWLKRLSFADISRKRSLWLPVAVGTALLATAGYQTLHGEYMRMQKRLPVEAYQGAATWLARHTPEGSRVFHTDWDDFPRLFFYNRHNTYIVGLDPDYMRLKNADMYQTWRNISRGKVRRPEDVIVNTFGTRYVFTDTKHKRFIKMADRNPQMQKVYNDRFAAVYLIRSADQ